MSTVELDDGFESFNFDYSIAGDVRDPYPELNDVRERLGVLAQDNPFDADGPASYQVYRYADVVRLFKDNVTFSSANLRETMGPAMGDHIILGMDEPEHRRHRGLVSTAFRQRALARWEETLVARIVDQLIDQFAEQGAVDLVPSFTSLFPSKVISGVLGLPEEDFRQFQRWAIAIISLHTNWDRGIAASQELKAYLAKILAERRRHPEDDVISVLATAELDGEHLDDEEIFSFLRLLLPAGVETTFRSSGNLLFLLLTHPDQLEAVRQDRSLLSQAVEEGIRYEPPLLITGRLVTTDTELCGVAIPAGSSAIPMLGAANRDPRVFAEPDRFDIFREAGQHLSFAHGVHVCLGMHLARMETRVAVDRLLDRLPNLRLDTERAEREDSHIHGEIFRSPTSVPAVWDV